MASSHAEIFGSLRIMVLNAMVESRHSIDDAFSSLSEPLIREHFQSVAEHMQKYLVSPSPLQLHQLASNWTAMLLGFGLSPRSALRTVVTLGDVVVQVSKRELAPGPSTNLFIRGVARLNFSVAREVVAIFNDELEALRSQQPRGSRAT